MSSILHEFKKNKIKSILIHDLIDDKYIIIFRELETDKLINQMIVNVIKYYDHLKTYFQEWEFIKQTIY